MGNHPYGDLQVYARRSWERDAIELFFRIVDRSIGKRYACAQITWAELPEAIAVTGESLFEAIGLNSTAAQQLMDDLWSCGVRPTEGEGSAGQSASQQSHIKDLREISTRLLGIVEKKG